MDRRMRLRRIKAMGKPIVPALAFANVGRSRPTPGAEAVSDKQERVRIQLADGNARVTMEFLPASGARGVMEFTPEQLDVLMESLAAARGQMPNTPQSQVKAEFRVTLDKNREFVTLETIVNGQVRACGVFTDTNQLDGFIHLLAAIREGMNDPIPQTLDPNPRLPVVRQPNWLVFEPTAQGRVLALRHPGFGWMAFLLPEAHAIGLAKLLLPSLKPSGT